MKIKLRQPDILFSKKIRTRDNWTCVRCHKRYDPPTQALHNSHYFGRARENTRFDEENCDALCFPCHRYWEGEGRMEYREFKIKQLGEKGFKNLQVRANMYKKKDDKLVMMYLKNERI